ncbi:hypothetical protein BHE74_00039150 [Ensete ventricosum]|nr:hypothetical protein BHE74_00039150 [Ensete ventricosum]
MPTSGSVPPPQTTPLTRAPPAHSLSNNINKQSVPCHYFQWGQCLKGERCPYMHGPQASVALVSQQAANASKLLPEPPQTSKKDRLQNATMQQNVTELNLDKPKTMVNMQIEMPSATTKLFTKVENAPNAELSENKRLPFCPLDDELPAAPQNVITTGGGHTLSKPWSHQIQATNEQPENGRDTDEFSREYSPGFDVLVEDDIKDPDYFHNEDDFRMVSAHGGQNLEPEEDYDYHHSDYELITNTGRDRSVVRGKYDNYEQTRVRHGREPKTSERFLDKPPSHGREVLDREAKLDEMDGSDLRHRLLKQRRLNGSRSTDSRDGHVEARREGNHTIGSHKVQDVGAVDGVITTEDGELKYDDIQSSTKADAVETEDGMGLENVEEEELENYCQRDGGFDYESGDFKANNDENAFQGDEEELDDEDDFARKVSVMLS